MTMTGLETVLMAGSTAGKPIAARSWDCVQVVLDPPSVSGRGGGRHQLSLEQGAFDLSHVDSLQTLCRNSDQHPVKMIKHQGNKTPRVRTGRNNEGKNNVIKTLDIGLIPDYKTAVSGYLSK